MDVLYYKIRIKLSNGKVSYEISLISEIRLKCASDSSGKKKEKKSFLSENKSCSFYQSDVLRKELANNIQWPVSMPEHWKQYLTCLYSGQNKK